MKTEDRGAEDTEVKVDGDKGEVGRELLERGHDHASRWSVSSCTVRTLTRASSSPGCNHLHSQYYYSVRYMQGTGKSDRLLSASKLF